MKFFVSTGEVSGDLHMSYLVNSVRKKYSDAKFYGVGGEHCRKAGVYIVQDIKDLAIMGFTEILKKYSFLKEKAREYVEFIKKENIKKVVLVDYGGFNLKFLELLKKEIPEVEVFYYIPPKLWIWGENRIKKLRLADHIMVIFPWEVDFYKKYGIDAIYYGNPFVEKYEIIKRTGENILLLPGSRKQEIVSLMPVLCEVARNNPDEKFILKLSSKGHLDWIEKIEKNITVEVENSLYKCVAASKVAIAASGTVTLELALMGIPTVVIYKTGFINAFIAKYILKVGFVSLPNLTLNKEVYPELLQDKCNASEIGKAIVNFENNKEETEKNILEVRKQLSGKNIVESYGDFLMKGER
ncbi:lipid-A-disaccharide synthase [uncultured Fusobacterium sp.]|uniref:lipid-A-disaccharide synthase n=1 Tax=uncultured Fusobacterium sp. TaxID=159267 RepID=UPI00258872E6|nr:lipid-A-disaccharide synthase [uncultured Fusobacterium sp.]